MKEILRTNIAGVQFADYQLAKNLKAGSKLTLIWEQSNPHDNNAIKIMFGKIKLGYIPRHLTSILHEYREAKIKLTCILTAYNKNNPSYQALHVKVVVKKTLENTKEVEL